MHGPCDPQRLLHDSWICTNCFILEVFSMHHVFQHAPCSVSFMMNPKQTSFRACAYYSLISLHVILFQDSLLVNLFYLLYLVFHKHAAFNVLITHLLHVPDLEHLIQILMLRANDICYSFLKYSDNCKKSNYFIFNVRQVLIIFAKLCD